MRTGTVRVSAFRVGIDVGDRAFEDLVRVGIDRDLGFGAGFDQADVLLEDVGDDPDRRQVGDLVERLAGHEAHALQRLSSR